MSMVSKLSGERLQALLQWLQQHDIAVTTDVTREFADGTLMAKLMIKLFPYRKSVYPTAGRHTSVQAKLTFWQLLNKKVLAPAGFGVDAASIERFVHCEPPAMQIYLHHIMEVEGVLQRGKVREAARQAASSGGSVPAARDEWHAQQMRRLSQLTTYSEYEDVQHDVATLEQHIMAVHLRNVNIEMEMSMKQQRLNELEGELANLLKIEQEQKAQQHS